MLLLALLSGIIIVLGGMIGGRTGGDHGLCPCSGHECGKLLVFRQKLFYQCTMQRGIGSRRISFLFDIVRRLSTNAGIPMPRICVIPEEAPNAFATGRDPQHAVVAV